MASWSVGAPLELTTQDYPALRQRARIPRMSPVVDPASDSVQVVGAVEHPSTVEAGHVHAGGSHGKRSPSAMNLSEALDAALPEIPRGRLTRVRPPCIDPALIVREDTLDGEAIVGAFQRSNGNYFRFSPLQWQLASLFDGVRTYDETASLFNEQTGAQLTPDEARLFAQNMDEADFWYQSPQEKNIALHEKLTAQRHRRAKRKSKINVAHISFSAWDPDRYLGWLDRRIGRFIYSGWCALAVAILLLFETVVVIENWRFISPDTVLLLQFRAEELG